MPIRRVKNRSTACGVPAEKTPAFSRKNGRWEKEQSAWLVAARVRFDLREIGVDGEVERETLRDART
jgi:hypothetical protein